MVGSKLAKPQGQAPGTDRTDAAGECRQEGAISYAIAGPSHGETLCAGRVPQGRFVGLSFKAKFFPPSGRCF